MKRRVEPQDSIFEPEDAHDELKAVENSVRGYVDERLEHLATFAGADPGSSYQRWRVEIWGSMILLLLAYGIFRDQLPGFTKESRPETTTTRAEEPVSAAADGQETGVEVDLAAIRANPLQAWASYVEQRPDLVAALMKDLAGGEDLPPDRVSSRQQKRFGDLADAIQDGQAPDANALADVLKGLFEYVVKRWQHERGELGDDEADLIDLVTSDAEYPPEILERILEDLGLELGEPNKTEPELQAAIVIAWLSEER